MILRKTFFAALLAVAAVLAQSNVSAQVFFAENFDYADGDLDVVSEGLWPMHSPDMNGTGPIQVVGGQAVVVSPGSFDHNRLTGVVQGLNDIWYYALNFSIDSGGAANINNDYFIHFKDATVFGFNARLALDDPADAANDFSLSIWASSEGDGQADWTGDFTFGEQLTCVVCWNNGTGQATLWVNPVDMSSTSIVDDELADAMRNIESIALRQDGGTGSVATIEALAVGTDFDAVLAAVADMNKGMPGDVNCDGNVDLLDVNPFVAAVSNGTYEPKADVNGDGADDLLDVAPFVALLTGK